MLQEQNCLQLDSFNEEDIMYDRIVQSVLEAQGTGADIAMYEMQTSDYYPFGISHSYKTSIKIATYSPERNPRIFMPCSALRKFQRNLILARIPLRLFCHQQAKRWLVRA